MTTELQFAASRARYASETRSRMERVMSDLAAIGEVDAGRAGGVLRRFREQHEASRVEGFTGIARLCRDMEDYLTEARGTEDQRLAAVASTLLDICRTIQLHGDAVGKGAIPAADNGGSNGDRPGTQRPPSPQQIDTPAAEGNHEDSGSTVGAVWHA